MRILFSGDTHGNVTQFGRLFGAAKRLNCDRIFVLGDFGYWEHQREGVEFLDRVSRDAIKAKTSVYFLDGNHDKTSLILERYCDERNDEGFLTVRGRLFYAPRGHQWNWGGKEFIALGGAYSVDKESRLDDEHKRKAKPGTFWFPEEEMTDQEMDEILGRPVPAKVDVMLAHDKPLGSDPKWNRKAFPECLPNQTRLQKAVEQLEPSLYLHGHLHYRYEEAMEFLDHEQVLQTCHVVGLNCDAYAADEPHYRYDPASSWIVYDTEKGELE